MLPRQDSETLPAPELKRLRPNDDDHGEHDECAMIRLGPQQADAGAMDVVPVPAAATAAAPVTSLVCTIKRTSYEEYESIWTDMWRDKHGKLPIPPELRMAMVRFKEALADLRQLPSQTQASGATVGFFTLENYQNMLARRQKQYDRAEAWLDLVQKEPHNSELYIEQIKQAEDRVKEADKALTEAEAEAKAEAAAAKAEAAAAKAEAAAAKAEAAAARVEEAMAAVNLLIKEHVPRVDIVVTHLLAPIQPLDAPKTAIPSKSTRYQKCVKKLLLLDFGVTDVIDFQRRILKDHLHLEDETFKLLKSLSIPDSSRNGSRKFTNENSMPGFILEDVSPRVIKILKTYLPKYTVDFKKGSETKGADMTIRVKDNSNRLVAEVPLELKIPTSGKHKDPDTSTNTEEYQQKVSLIKHTGLLPINVADCHIGQVYNQCETNTKNPKSSVLQTSGSIYNYAILSNFNKTWFIKTDTSNSTAWICGTPFLCDNTSPHIAFAYVAFLDRIISEWEKAHGRQSQHPAPSEGMTRSSNSGPGPRSPRTRSASKGASKGASKRDRETGARQASPKGRKKGLGGQQLDMDESPDGFVDLSSDYGTVIGDCTKVATIALHSDFSGSLTPPYTDMSSIGSPSELFASQVWANRCNEWLPIICNFSMDAELGNGRSGVVYKAMYNGSPVALKLCSANSERDIIDEMYNEVKVYKHLESLQGDCIPRLLTQGLVTYENMLYVAIVLELIEEAPELRKCKESDRADNCPRQARDDALRALDRIHSLGVAHKDARMINVLFEAADGELKPRIIDFAFSKVDASQEEINIDRSEWLDVLYLD